MQRSRWKSVAAHIKGIRASPSRISLSLSLSIYLHLYLFLPFVDYTQLYTPVPTWKSNSILHEMNLETPLASRRGAAWHNVEHGSACFINPVSAKRDWKIRKARVLDLRGARLENFQSAIRHQRRSRNTFSISMHKATTRTRNCWIFRANPPRDTMFKNQRKSYLCSSKQIQLCRGNIAGIVLSGICYLND